MNGFEKTDEVLIFLFFLCDFDKYTYLISWFSKTTSQSNFRFWFRLFQFSSFLQVLDMFCFLLCADAEVRAILYLSAEFELR